MLYIYICDNNNLMKEKKCKQKERFERKKKNYKKKQQQIKMRTIYGENVNVMSAFTLKFIFLFL